MRASFGGNRYVRLEGKIIGIDRFGESSKDREVREYLGFIVENMISEYLLLI